MAWRYVQAVMDDWAHLPDRRYRILLRMARLVLDEPRDGKPAGTYYGGHEYLAAGLHTPLPLEGKARANALRNVRREVYALAHKDHAIKVVETGRKIHTGTAQTYLIVFAPVAKRAGSLRPSSEVGAREDRRRPAQLN
jgi:hypothetical protein